jgi:hypothetical protein
MIELAQSIVLVELDNATSLKRFMSKSGDWLWLLVKQPSEQLVEVDTVLN